MENKEYIEKIKNKIKQIYNLGCYTFIKIMKIKKK